MSLVFINGLMPDRHGLFLRRLAAEHTLAGTNLGELADDPNVDTISYVDDQQVLASPLARDLEARLDEQTALLAENLARDVGASPVGPPPGWRLDDRTIRDDIRPRVAAILLQELRFELFRQQHPVDMVISGADYGSHARVIARAARAEGTLTLDLEHGFFFTRTAPQYVRTRGWLPLFFASEHVNLDNALEKELFEEEAARFPDQGTRFLALGTPVDTVASQAVSREAGIAALGLDRDRLQVAVIGSWHEARNIQKLLTDQVDTIGLYEDLFTALATGDRGRGIQLTVKLHPADARPDVLPGVQAGLARLAERCGLEPPLVLGDGLPEVLGACDVVVSLGFSSVQYDAFLLGKPSLILLPETVRRRVPDSWFTGGTVPMRYGVCTAVTSGAEVWRLVDEFQRPDRQRTFRDALAALTRRYDLRPRTVAEKCDRVLAWIAENLGNS